MVVGGESEKGMGWVRCKKGMGWVWCEEGGVAWCVSRYRKMKMKNTHTETFFSFWFWVLWAQSSIVVVSVDLLGAAQVIHSAGEHVWGFFLLTWR
jgi:hypothetical protein